MLKLFNIYQDNKLVTCLFAEECVQPHGIAGLLVQGATNPKDAVAANNLMGLSIVEDPSKDRWLSQAFIESYHLFKTDDTHLHFARLLGITRDEAKGVAHEIIFRGSREYRKHSA